MKNQLSLKNSEAEFFMRRHYEFFFVFFEVRLQVDLFLMIEIKQSIKTEKNKMKMIRSDEINKRERENE